MATELKFDPVEVQIRHGIFWYFAREKQVVTDSNTGRLKEQDVLIQRVANQNDKITLHLESDYQRGVDHHAFWTDEELAAARVGPTGVAVVPVGADGTVDAPEPLLEGSTPGGGTEAPPEPLSHDLSDRPVEDLTEWIMAAGEFDGQKKPNAGEVISAAGNNPDLAQRLLDAEERARGDQGPRSTVVAGLESVIAENTASSEREGDGGQ
jgi:hypothetical protein